MIPTLSFSHLYISYTHRRSIGKGCRVISFYKIDYNDQFFYFTQASGYIRPEWQNSLTFYLVFFFNLQLTTKLNANFTTAQQWFKRTMLITLSVLKMNIKIKNKINYSIIVSLILTSTSIYFLTDFTETCLLNSVWVLMSTFAFLSWQTFSPYILIDPGGLLSSSVNVRFPEIEGDVFLHKNTTNVRSNLSSLTVPSILMPSLLQVELLIVFPIGTRAHSWVLKKPFFALWFVYTWHNIVVVSSVICIVRCFVCFTQLLAKCNRSFCQSVENSTSSKKTLDHIEHFLVPLLFVI